MGLFDYQSFHVIAKFLNNREVIVWCTKLMRSDADERVNVEVAFARKRSWMDFASAAAKSVEARRG